MSIRGQLYPPYYGQGSHIPSMQTILLKAALGLFIALFIGSPKGIILFSVALYKYPNNSLVS